MAKAINDPQMLTMFLSYKLNIQNRSALTVSEYGNDLRLFIRYILVLRENGDFEKLDEKEIDNLDEAFFQSITTSEIYSFLIYLANGRKNAPASRARKLSAVRAFFKYHSSKSHILKDNPAKDIDSPSMRQKLPKHLSLDESLDLLSSVDRSDENYERNYCILTFFLNCGMRLSELVGLNLYDIEQDMSQMTVTGKGNKMRVIYLNSACRSALTSYLNVRTAKISERGGVIKDKNALFLSSRGQRISNKTVQWLVKKHLSLSGLEHKGYSTHKLRHTAATLMYSTGKVDVRVLKEILGHEQLNTTQIYTHVANAQLESAMEENPLAKVKTKKKQEQ